MALVPSSFLLLLSNFRHPVTTLALVPSSFLLLYVKAPGVRQKRMDCLNLVLVTTSKALLLLAWHLFLVASC